MARLEEVKILTEKKKLRHCGATEGKEKCPHTTNHPSGLCPEHRKEFELYFSSMILRCAECPVRTLCRLKDQAPQGVCYFELYDRSTRMDDKDQLEFVMKKIVRSEFLLHGRLQRVLAHEKDATTNDKLLRAFNTLSNNLFAHLEGFGKFMGWSAPKWIKEDKELRVKYLKKVLMISDKSEGDEKEIIEIEVPEEE